MQGDPGTEVASGPFTKARWAEVQLPVRQEGYPQPGPEQWQVEPVDAKGTQQHSSSHRCVCLSCPRGCLAGLTTLSEQLQWKGLRACCKAGTSQAGRNSTLSKAGFLWNYVS